MSDIEAGKIHTVVRILIQNALYVFDPDVVQRLPAFRFHELRLKDLSGLREATFRVLTPTMWITKRHGPQELLQVDEFGISHCDLFVFEVHDLFDDDRRDLFEIAELQLNSVQVFDVLNIRIHVVHSI